MEDSKILNLLNASKKYFGDLEDMEEIEYHGFIISKCSSSIGIPLPTYV